MQLLEKKHNQSYPSIVLLLQKLDDFQMVVQLSVKQHDKAAQIKNAAPEEAAFPLTFSGFNPCFPRLEKSSFEIAPKIACHLNL
jgi:hypothetical protein